MPPSGVPAIPVDLNLKGGTSASVPFVAQHNKDRDSPPQSQPEYIKDKVRNGLREWLNTGQTEKYVRGDSDQGDVPGESIGEVLYWDEANEDPSFEGAETFKIDRLILRGRLETADFFASRVPMCGHGSPYYWIELWRLRLVYRGTYTAFVTVRRSGRTTSKMLSAEFSIILDEYSYRYLRPMRNWQEICDELRRIQKESEANPSPTQNDYRGMAWGSEFRPDPPPDPPPEDEKRKALIASGFDWSIGAEHPGTQQHRDLLRHGTLVTQPTASDLNEGFLQNFAVPVDQLMATIAVSEPRQYPESEAIELRPTKNVEPMRTRATIVLPLDADWNVVVTSSTEVADADPDQVQVRQRPRLQ